jgi:hypothetical protein
VRQAGGEALVLYVEKFEGLSEQQIIELFRQARQQEYLEIDTQAKELEKKISAKQPLEVSEIKEAIAKLKKRYSEIVNLDFFACPDAGIVAARLTRIEQLFKEENSTNLISVKITEYQYKRWVTRPRPFIDRLACIWLIRKFIDSNAVIRYSLQPEIDEIAFDMKEAEFGLEQPAIKAIAKIVHELDLRDGLYISPETLGVETIIRGWLLANLTDIELESLGIKLFDGLYLAFLQAKNY